MIGTYIIINIVSMEKIVDFINFLKSLGFIVIDWFIDFKTNITCIVCSIDYLYCFCCGKRTFYSCKRFHIVLCDDCKLQKHYQLSMISKEHGFFVPYLDLLKL